MLNLVQIDGRECGAVDSFSEFLFCVFGIRLFDAKKRSPELDSPTTTQEAYSMTLAGFGLR